MMKRLFTLCLMLAACGASFAQTQGHVRFGYASYRELLQLMPEYSEVQVQMNELKTKYEAEARYNETAFKRMFAEFLQGQKDFPQNILLKRQRDLQDAMEKGLAFRQAADSLLRAAEHDLMAPLRARLDSAVSAVGLERGYGYVVNTDDRTYLFLHPQVAEDATSFILEKLTATKP